MSRTEDHASIPAPFISQGEAEELARRAGVYPAMRPGMSINTVGQNVEPIAAEEIPDPVLDPPVVEAVVEVAPVELPRAAWERPEGCRILKSNADFAITYGKSWPKSDGVTVPKGHFTPSEMRLPLAMRKRMRINAGGYYEFSEAEIQVLIREEQFLAYLRRGIYTWAPDGVPETAYDREERLEREVLRLRAENVKLKSDMDKATAPA